MGSYVSISVAGLDIITYKNRIGDLLLVFSKSDYHTEEYQEDGERYTRRFYSTNVERVRKRLDVLGYTLQRMKKIFYEIKEEYIMYIDDEEDLKLYEKEYMYDKWQEALIRMVNGEVQSEDRFSVGKDSGKNNNCTFAEAEILKSMELNDDLFFGIYIDWYAEPQTRKEICWLVFRAILEGYNSNEEVVVDFTDLYEGGWCSENLYEEVDNVPKTIILTEGKYDIRVLSKSIKLLYPGMEKYYTFFDFDTFKTKGSTDEVVKYVKAFASAKIENRVIALLDNDAAGMEAKKQLEAIKLPNNFRVMTLPDVKIAEKYLTIGPTGEEFVNVNGRACSIEMYLGRDVLFSDGNFEPVMWEGYKEKVKCYQGALKNKVTIQKKFDKKISQAEKDGIFDEENWTELRLVLEMIFIAFV